MKKKSYFKIWNDVFSNKKYVLLFFLVAILFYLINAFIFQYKNIFSFGLSSAPMFLFQGFYSSMTHFTFYNIIILGILTGILVSLLTYRFYISKDGLKGLGLLSTIGLFLGIIAPGCAACGIGLAPTLGLSALILSLPFKGSEIAIIAIFLLVFSIGKVTESFNKKNVCDLNIEKKEILSSIKKLHKKRK